MKLLIDGEFRESQATKWIDVTNPVSSVVKDPTDILYHSVSYLSWYTAGLCVQATQDVVSRLPETTEQEFNAAVQSARNAFPAWKKTPVSTRARVMFKMQQLIRDHMVSLA